MIQMPIPAVDCSNLRTINSRYGAVKVPQSLFCRCRQTVDWALLLLECGVQHFMSLSDLVTLPVEPERHVSRNTVFDRSFTMSRRDPQLMWGVAFIRVSVIYGWLVGITWLSVIWVFLILTVVNMIMMEHDSFGCSVNVLRNCVQFSRTTLFVTASVVCTWIVGISGHSMAWLLVLMILVFSEFWEVQTFRTDVTFLQRDAQLSWTLIFVAASVVCSWVLGTTGLSLAWLLLLLALVAAVWKASLVRLVEAAVSYETLRVRRKRALSQDETAEWFNFLLNRW